MYRVLNLKKKKVDEYVGTRKKSRCTQFVLIKQLASQLSSLSKVSIVTFLFVLDEENREAESLGYANSTIAKTYMPSLELFK